MRRRSTKILCADLEAILYSLKVISNVSMACLIGLIPNKSGTEGDKVLYIPILVLVAIKMARQSGRRRNLLNLFQAPGPNKGAKIRYFLRVGRIMPARPILWRILIIPGLNLKQDAFPRFVPIIKLRRFFFFFLVHTTIVARFRYYGCWLEKILRCIFRSYPEIGTQRTSKNLVWPAQNLPRAKQKELGVVLKQKNNWQRRLTPYTFNNFSNK